MKFEKTEVWGFEHALRGMRNPKESWNKSDSGWCDVRDCRVEKCAGCNCYDYEKNPYKCSLVDDNGEYRNIEMKYHIGKNDLELAQELIRAGSVHRKFMRQIFVSVDITAPLYWWKEFDTYKVGTVANSTSTMHKLASTPITKYCFEMDDFNELDKLPLIELENVRCTIRTYWEWVLIPMLEKLRQKYNETKDKRYWKELIRLLPESWLQTRTVTMDYENLIGICSTGQRRNHKLTEWSKSFIDWAKSLPYANELLFVDKKREVDFVMKYENGVYKCKYNSGEEFESSDGKTWVQIL